MNSSLEKSSSKSFYIRPKPMSEFDGICEEFRHPSGADYMEQLYGISKKSPRKKISTLVGSATATFGQRGVRIDEKASQHEDVYFLYEEISRITETAVKKKGFIPLAIGVALGVIFHPLWFLLAFVGFSLVVTSCSAVHMFIILFDSDTNEEVSMYCIMDVEKAKKKEIYQLIREKVQTQLSSKDCTPEGIPALKHLLGTLPK